MSFSLKHKLFASLLLIGLLAVSMTSYLGYTRAKTALERSIFTHLTSVREARADQIESYFKSISDEANDLTDLLYQCHCYFTAPSAVARG